jgi:hypothetical protein
LYNATIMREIHHLLGLTENAYRNVGVTRRSLLIGAKDTLLVTAGAKLASGCTPRSSQENRNNGQQITIAESRLRRVEGAWGVDDIRHLAAFMTSEPEYTTIAKAGHVLLDSHTNNPSVSQLTPIFEDAPIKISTIRYGVGPLSGANMDAPFAAEIVGVGNPIQVPVRSKIDGLTTNIPAPLKMRLDRIIIDRTVSQELSDFIFGLYIAKEIYNSQAFDMASLYSKHVSFDPAFELTTQNELFDRAAQISRLQEKVEKYQFHI